MKTTSIVLSVLFLLLAFQAFADSSAMNIFEATIGEESYQGHFDGQCGIWQKDFNSMLEFEDLNGMSRELFTDKIDYVEIIPQGNSKPQVVVGIGGKKIKGTFPCMTNLVTDTGKIDLLSSKLNKKVTLKRVRAGR